MEASYFSSFKINPHIVISGKQIYILRVFLLYENSGKNVEEFKNIC